MIGLIVGPIIHVINVVQNNEEKKNEAMTKDQKLAYKISMFGAFSFIVTIIIAIISMIIYFFKLVSLGPEGVGFILALFILPALLMIGLGIVNVYIPLMYGIPTVYKSIQKLSSIFIFISGVIGIVTMTTIVFLMTVAIYGFSPSVDIEITDIFDDFHPLKHVTAIFYISPILLIVGGVLGYLNARKAST